MKLCAALMATIALSLSACANGAAYGTETERTLCRELREVLPTYSALDTQQTLEDGDRFLTVFDEVCR